MSTGISLTRAQMLHTHSILFIILLHVYMNILDYSNLRSDGHRANRQA